MNTQNLQQHFNDLIDRMKSDNYDVSLIGIVKNCIEFVLREGGKAEIPDYESAFIAIVKERGYSEERALYGAYKVGMGHVKAFDLEGRFPSKGVRQNAFLKQNPSAYDRLCPFFNQIVDNYKDSCASLGRRERTVYNESSMASCFFFHCQELGAYDLDSISESMMRSFFYDGEKIIRGYDSSHLIMNVLKTTERREWFIARMPCPRRHKKNVDFLNDDEVEKIAHVLHDPNSPLSPLDRAVGNTLFHLGIRGTDIMKLDFSNIDWKKKEIRLIQSKTESAVSLPLLPAVGNAILDYLKEQRPKGGETVFLTDSGPSRALMSLCPIVNRIFDAAGVRMNGEQRGIRLFRHHLATYLITHGVKGQVVSRILGHDCPTSLDAYVDLDLDGLRSCVLSIEQFTHVLDSGSQHCPPPKASGKYRFRSSLAGQMEAFIIAGEYRSEAALIPFDRYCADNHPDAEALSVEMMQGWCALRSESESNRKARTATSRKFAAYSNQQGWSSVPARLLLATPLSVNGDGDAESRLSAGPKRRPYHSLLATQMSEFEEHRRAADKWSESYSDFLHTFDNHCFRMYPEESVLSDSMLEWCRQRPTECKDSCGARTYAAWAFAEYANLHGWADVEIKRPSTGIRRDRTPHYFTDEEISRFLDECISFFLERRQLVGKGTDLVYALQYPVFVLLLFSSGIRTCEARWLHVEDFKREEGYLDIRKSKQADEHRVPLSPSMVELLCKYDAEMANLMPGRTVFFPQDGDAYHSRKWHGKYFRQIWPRVSDKDARLYDLRNTFATRNISSWEGQGMVLEEKIIRLSRVMGHSSMSSTFGYFTPSEMLDDKLRKQSDANLNELIRNTTSHGKREQ